MFGKTKGSAGKTNGAVGKTKVVIGKTKTIVGKTNGAVGKTKTVVGKTNVTVEIIYSPPAIYKRTLFVPSSTFCAFWDLTLLKKKEAEQNAQPLYIISGTEWIII